MFAEIANMYKKDFKVILIDFLGHGKSDRLHEFPTDLWFNKAQQVISFLKEKRSTKVKTSAAYLHCNCLFNSAKMLATCLQPMAFRNCSIRYMSNLCNVIRQCLITVSTICVLHILDILGLRLC